MLPISIGQAGNQINIELIKQIIKEQESDVVNIKTINQDLYKNIVIDSEQKVINKNYLNSEFSKYYFEGINLLKNNNGRGNNWALGYSMKYKELNSKLDICSLAFEMINKFVEKCEFLKGFIIIHSINGGTGSGVASRLIELLRDYFPKFIIIDCFVSGFNSIFIVI